MVSPLGKKWVNVMTSTLTSLLFICLSFLCYAFWGTLNGIVNKNIEPFSSLFYSSIGYMVAGLISVSFINFQPKFSTLSFGSSVLLGLTTGLGGLFLLLAIQRFDSASILIAATATYPIATVILNYFILKEVLTLKQIVGCLLSIVGVILMLI